MSHFYLLKRGCLIALLCSANVSAEVLVSTAHVVIVPPIEITEVQQIDFGTLSSQDGTCDMGASGQLSGFSGQTCQTTRTPGIFSVKGFSDQLVLITVSGGAAQDGVTFTPQLVGGDTQTLTNGDLQVTVVGVLSLTSATVGSRALPYTLTVTYQ